MTTDDRRSQIRTYVGDGYYVDDPLNAWQPRRGRVPASKLMQYVCKNGFEHHAAMNASHSAGVLAEAFETYLGWEVYHHVG